MNVSGNNSEAVKKLNIIFFSMMLSKKNTNIGGLGGNAEEYYKLCHFKHIIEDKGQEPFTIDKQNHIFTWSEKFILDSSKSDIRNAISAPEAQKSLEDNVVYNDFIKIFKEENAEASNSYKEVFSYYEENKSKFPGIEDALQGKDVSLVHNKEPEDIATAFIITALISKEMDNSINATIPNSISADEWVKHPVVGPAIKAIDKFSFNDSFLAIRMMIGLSKIVMSNFDEVPFASEVFKKSNDMGEELTAMK